MSGQPAASPDPGAATARAAVDAAGVDAAEAVTAARTLVGRARAAARAHKRSDLERLLHQALQRLGRPETVVLVAGEFKQGKSSLINALLGIAACPVDDDLATAAVTVVRHGPAVEITIRRRAGAEAIVEAIAVDQLPDYVTERGNPENRRGLEVVEIRAPNGLLERGWAFIDTPGIGGLNPAQAAAALAFLPLADALLFVSDAAAELSAAELHFLARARETCPTVLVALSKIDLYPAWREIEVTNRRHLATRGIDVPTIPVSSLLRAHALGRADAELDAESGIPHLLATLQTDVLEASRSGAIDRAVSEASRVIRQLQLPLEHAAAALRDPTHAQRLDDELAATRERLQALRGPASRWGQRLNDRFSELAASVDYGFRAAMRATVRRAADQIERMDPARGWEATTEALQGEVATAVGEASNRLVEGAAAIRAELATLIRDEAIAAEGPDRRALDVGELWSGKPITGSTIRAGVGMGYGALKGAQSGVLLIGVLGNLFNLALIGPVLLGGAAVFAGKSMLDERRRLLSQRRQEAHGVVRQYVDDVQFEVGTRMRDLLRELQREIRDDAGARVEELQRTYADAVAKLESTRKQSGAERSKDLAAVDRELDALRDLDRRLARVAAATPQADTASTSQAAAPPAKGAST